MLILLSKFQITFLCFFVLLPLSLQAYPSSTSRLLDFSLSIQSQSSKTVSPVGTNKINIDQLGINWYEHFSHYFHAGLEVGYIEMTQANNPVISAQYTSGQFAGLLLRFTPVKKTNFSLLLDLNYRYNRTEGNSNSQQTQFSWDETTLSAEFQYRPGNTVGLYAAAEYLKLSGEQRDSGTITQLQDFSEKEQQGYRFGLQLVPYQGGIIGLERFSGYRNGGRIYFRRQF